MLLSGSLEAGVLFRIFGGGGLKLPQALSMINIKALRMRLREACMADGFCVMKIEQMWRTKDQRK